MEDKMEILKIEGKKVFVKYLKTGISIWVDKAMLKQQGITKLKIGEVHK